MEQQNPQSQQSNIPPVEPKKNWFASHMIVGYVFLFAVLAVAVSGIYYWQTVRQIPSSYQVIVHKGPTAGWQTYVNSQYGFSFKYPSDWTYTTSAGTISFFPPGKTPGYEYNGDIIVSVVNNPNSLDLKTFYNQQGSYSFFTNSVSQTALNINSYSAEKFIGVYGMLPTDDTVVNKGKILIDLSDVGQMHETDGIFDAMANSVK